MLKFVPVIVTTAPIAPPAGLKLVIIGVGNTSKSVALIPVIPPTLTEIFPVVAPAGTSAVILVAEDAETVAATPLNATKLLAGVLLKLDPVIITEVPTAP